MDSKPTQLQTPAVASSEPNIDLQQDVFLQQYTTAWEHNRLALHTIVDEVDGRIITSTGEPLNTYRYSQFKYGHRQQANLYGEQLTKKLLESPIAERFDGQVPIIVSASAYKRLVTAAQFVADSVTERMRWSGYLVQQGRIHRSRLTEGDYGKMSAAERQYWMASNGLSIDTAVFENRHIVVVDDVNVTGSHERAIWGLFADLPIQSLTNLYVVKLDPDLARRDPTIEDRMNHASITGLSDLYQLMWDDYSYKPTARTVKFILSRPLDALKKFVAKIDGGDLRAIHMGLLDDGYYAMKSYHEGAQIILGEVAKRKKVAQRAASKKGVRLDIEQKVWIQWDPKPYDAPIPDTASAEQVVPAVRRRKEFNLFGYSLTLAKKDS